MNRQYCQLTVELGPRVQQQQRVGVHCAAGAGLGAIVDDGAVGARACGAGTKPKCIVREGATSDPRMMTPLGPAPVCGGDGAG